MTKVIYVFIVVCLVGCSDSLETHPEFESGICLGEPETIESPFCTMAAIDTTKYCKVIESGRIFSFTEQDLLWLPSYCCEKDDEVAYEDENGNQTLMRVNYKIHRKSMRGYHFFDMCEDESLAYLYCALVETASVNLYSELLGYDIDIQLQLNINSVDSNTPKQGGQISILTYLDSGTIVTHFTAIVEKGTLDVTSQSFADFFPEIEIAGSTFYNVFSYVNTVQSQYIKMFYNKKYGLVGFLDYDNNQWKIKI